MEGFPFQTQACWLSSGFFAERGPNPAAITGVKPIQWSKLILRVENGLVGGGGSAALPAQLSPDFGLCPVEAQMVDVLLRSRDSRLGPGHALSSFLFYFQAENTDA